MHATDHELLARWTDRADSEAFSELVARHGRMVLGVCRRIVGDPQLADDVAQECFVRLAEEREAKPRNLGGWLHRIAANRAVSALRNRLRRAGELAEEPTHGDTPERLAEWREIERHVDAAIAELPEELRTALVGHFLQGRSHRELAGDLDVAARTVGYRIERGIERVRAALEARGVQLGRDGLPAVLLALPRVDVLPATWTASLGKVAIAGPRATVVVGGAQSSAKTLLVLAAMLAVLLTGGVWWFGSGSPEAMPETRLASSSTAAVEQVSASVPGASLSTEAEDLPRLDAPGVASSEDVVITGRCVDEAGAPLSGVTVQLHGRTGNHARRDEWILEHGSLDWVDPDPIHSADDGSFELRFEPLPPVLYSLRITAHGCVPLRSAMWPFLVAGQQIALGDIVLPRGTMLFGSVCDEEGRPVRSDWIVTRKPADLSMFRMGNTLASPSTTMEPKDSVSAPVNENGGFEMEHPIPTGTRVTFEVRGFELVAPDEPVMVQGERMEVQVVVRARHREGEPTTIRGVVVTPTGEPIEGARLLPEVVEPFAFETDVRRIAGSLEGGRFTIHLPAGAASNEPLTTLHVQAFGYLSWTNDAPIAWGTDDLRIVLLPGTPLRVTVRRGDDGAPVERFGLRFAPIRPNQGWSGEDEELRFAGDHPGGICDVPGLTPYRYRVTAVAPASTGLAPCQPVEVDLHQGGSREIELTIPPFAERRVLVVQDDGTPIPNARVELVRHVLDGTVTLGMKAVPAQYVRNNAPDLVVESHAEGTTSADGAFLLRATAGLRYALRLPGPGHVPMVVQDVHLEDPEPLRVEISAGASVLGRITPLAVLEQLRAIARSDDPSGRRGVGVFLLPDPASPIGIPDQRTSPLGQPIDVDGRFRIAGLPPGTWDVVIHWTPDAAPLGGWTGKSEYMLRGLQIASGEHHEIECDIADLARVECSFLVRANGEPAAARLEFRSEDRPGRNERAVADEEGRTTVMLPAGSWTSSVEFQVGRLWIRAPGPAFSTSTATSRPIEVSVHSGRRRVRLERPDGTPAAGVRLFGVAAQPTDVQGRTTLVGAAGPVQVYVARQADEAMAQMTWLMGRGRTTIPEGFLSLGEVLLPDTPAEEFVLRLPSDWARD